MLVVNGDRCVLVLRGSTLFSVVLVVLVSSRWVGRWVIGVVWWSQAASSVVRTVKLNGRFGVCVCVVLIR